MSQHLQKILLDKQNQSKDAGLAESHSATHQTHATFVTILACAQLIFVSL
jgi:hypothetical protein